MKRTLLILLLVFAFVLFLLPFLIPLPGPEGISAASLAPPTGQFLTIDGRQIYIEEVGPVGGEPVILIHGFGGSTFSWRETLPALADAGFHAVALDLAGFGLSEKDFEADYSHGAQADRVAAVMDDLQIDAATIIGHSMGGSVLAHFYARYPERVDKLVIVDGAIDYGEGRGGGFPALQPLVRFAPTQRWLRIGLRLYLNDARFASLLQSAAYDRTFLSEAVREGYARPLQVKNWDLALLGIVRDSSENRLSFPLQEITAPTLIIWGAEDSWVPLQQGEALHAALPNSRLVVLPDAGHLPMEEKPAAFNSQLLSFLQAD